jgi:hypothetical protein
VVSRSLLRANLPIMRPLQVFVRLAGYSDIKEGALVNEVNVP